MIQHLIGTLLSTFNMHQTLRCGCWTAEIFGAMSTVPRPTTPPFPQYNYCTLKILHFQCRIHYVTILKIVCIATTRHRQKLVIVTSKPLSLTINSGSPPPPSPSNILVHLTRVLNVAYWVKNLFTINKAVHFFLLEPYHAHCKSIYFSSNGLVFFNFKSWLSRYENFL